MASVLKEEAKEEDKRDPTDTLGEEDEGNLCS